MVADKELAFLLSKIGMKLSFRIRTARTGSLGFHSDHAPSLQSIDDTTAARSRRHVAGIFEYPSSSTNRTSGVTAFCSGRSWQDPDETRTKL